MDLKITPSGQTIVKPTALGPVANTDTKLLIYGLFQKGRVLAQDGMLVDNRSLALLYVDASNLAAVEHDYGAAIYEQVRAILTNLILDMRGVETRRDDLVTVKETHGDTFLIFLSKKREERPFGQGDLETMADRIHEYLTRRLTRMTSSYLRRRLKLGIGYSLVLHNPLINADRLVLQLIEEARRMADIQDHRLSVKSKEVLQEIILKEDVRTLFQPIIDLRSRETLGYEGLTRGPQGTEFESPYMLFDILLHNGLLEDVLFTRTDLRGFKFYYAAIIRALPLRFPSG